MFTSVPDFAPKLRRYVDADSANAQPIHTQMPAIASVETIWLRHAAGYSELLLAPDIDKIAVIMPL